LVTEANFPPGRAEQMVASGHLKRITPYAPKGVTVGVLIPDRGDRPLFLEQCKKMLARQTFQPAHVFFADWEPKSSDLDVTERYRIGCAELFAKGCEVVIFMESDDWYAANYIELMLQQWDKAKRPDIFGIGQTIYYHIFGKRYVFLEHKKRASAMSTMVTRAILSMSWPRDNNPYLDVEMWHQLQGRTWIPLQPICIGIKHGMGMVGGGAHEQESLHYRYDDPTGKKLREIIGEDDYKFYESLKNVEV
jgi:hypothetical protein